MTGVDATRVRLLGALVAGPLLMVAALGLGAATAGYDAWSETVSRIASPGQPLAGPMAATFVLYGLLVVWAATPLADAVVSGSRPAAVLLAIYGAAGVACGLAPKDLPGAEPTVASSVHVAATVVGGGAILAVMVLAVRRTSGAERVVAGVALVLTVTAAVVLRQTWGTPVYGAVERIVLGVPMSWLTAVAARSLGFFER